MQFRRSVSERIWLKVSEWFQMIEKQKGLEVFYLHIFKWNNGIFFWKCFI